MTGDRLFLDTVFIQALLNRRDQYYQPARVLLPRVRSAHEVWVTEAILLEVGNALANLDRIAAVSFIQETYRTGNVHVVTVDTALLKRALALYEARADKAWGLTDCLSFVVMHDRGDMDALTADEHFVQAGFVALMGSPRSK